MSQKPEIVKLSRVVAVSTVLLGVLCYVWILLNANGTVYLATYYPLPWWGMYTCLAALLILFPVALALSRWRPWCLAALSIVAAITFCNGGLIVSIGGSEWCHLQSATLTGRVYHLAYRFDDHGLVKYKLCECEGSSILCDCHYFYSGRYHLEPTEMIVDGLANELHIHIDSELIYTFGAHPRCHVDYGCYSISE